MKIKPKIVKVTVPHIMSVNDYHEIEYVLDYLNGPFNGKMKALELSAPYDGEYYAIFFFKKDKEYKFLIKEWKEFHGDDE